MIVRAIGIMILSMALLAMSDAFIKLAAQYAPMGQIMFAISTGGTLMFLVMARIKGFSLVNRDALHRMVLLRNLFEIVGAIGLVVGISKIPLSVFAAIMQVAPLLTILGAALFLGEEVGWRRWAAILVGLIGMLIVIRPFGSAFSGWELFAVLGVTGLAARDLVTRLAPSHIPALSMSAWGFAATIPVGLVIFLFETKPLDFAPITLMHLVGAVVFTAIGYLAVTAAMRMAPVSIIAPYRYARLIFTSALGILIFAERPDGYTLLGAALVLGAGLYSFLRERKLAQG
ncbi:DMT family transporter [Tropicibacter sp. R15_0]|uniref:DMT family transporter n=1 Tax=Tropicibacter sp. R15_0 TaxID=2821101 RepID=UPI001ADBFDBF|nr:DMT family transporter [Tropicibacter sp. R15_0]MBO9464910.1 DMT family transporter [Tropicibacter sp. R15_0]